MGPSPTGHATSDILGLLEGVEEASVGRCQQTRSQHVHRQVESNDQQQQRSIVLAQRCMALSDKLEEERTRCAETVRQLDIARLSMEKVKSDSEATVTRHQAFINQLLKEKRALGEQCAALVKEMEGKNRKMLKTLEGRHAVEMKKQEERLLAQEKLRRDKWVDSKTKKIKEMTVAGVESELTRLSSVHQQELKEMRRRHDDELTRVEQTWSRRLHDARLESNREREEAVSQERQAATTRTDNEVARLEKEHGEAKRNLLQELREERQRVELQLERTLADRSAVLDNKYQQALAKLDDRLVDINKQHEEELCRLREGVETEREGWLAHQTQALLEKEQQVRAEAKKERDRHIQAAITKIDQESLLKQQTADNKIARLKESWEEERNDLETEARELKRRLKETKSELEETKQTLDVVRSQTGRELVDTRNELTQVRSHLGAKESYTETRITQLEEQLSQARHLHQEALADRQNQMDILYNRVKEAVSKKDEQMRALQKERDAALEQCSQLETIMERRTTLD